MKTLKWYIGMAVCCMCWLTACQDDDKTDVDVNGTPEQEEEVKKDEPQHLAPPQETSTRKEITLTESEQGVAALGADFAFRLLQAVETSLSPAQRGQIVLSPLSAEIALAMLTNGAVSGLRRRDRRSGRRGQCYINGHPLPCGSSLPVPDYRAQYGYGTLHR